MEYLVDNEYSKESEKGVIWNNPKMGVEWPITNPVPSEKDAKWPCSTGLACFPGEGNGPHFCCPRGTES